MDPTRLSKMDNPIIIIRARMKAIFSIVYLLFREMLRRVYSNTVYYVIRRDLAVKVDVPKPKINVKLRQLDKKDIPKLLDVFAGGLSALQIWERIRILLMIKSGIQTPYVVVTDNDEPCHIAWLIDFRENEKMQVYFKKRIPPLKPDEVMIEFIFTLEKYRGQGIQLWRSGEFVDKSAASGARQAIAFIKKSNVVSMHNSLKNAFEPFMTEQTNGGFFVADRSLN